MSENEDKKFGNIIHKGRLIDVDKLSAEEREKIIEELERECDRLENEIDSILEIEK